jgi:hypothetical protein
MKKKNKKVDSICLMIRIQPFIDVEEERRKERPPINSNDRVTLDIIKHSSGSEDREDDELSDDDDDDVKNQRAVVKDEQWLRDQVNLANLQRAYAFAGGCYLRNELNEVFFPDKKSGRFPGLADNVEAKRYAVHIYVRVKSSVDASSSSSSSVARQARDKSLKTRRRLSDSSRSSSRVRATRKRSLSDRRRVSSSSSVLRVDQSQSQSDNACHTSWTQLIARFLVRHLRRMFRQLCFAHVLFAAFSLLTPRALSRAARLAHSWNYLGRSLTRWDISKQLYFLLSFFLLQ